MKFPRCRRLLAWLLCAGLLLLAAAGCQPASTPDDEPASSDVSPESAGEDSFAPEDSQPPAEDSSAPEAESTAPSAAGTTAAGTKPGAVTTTTTTKKAGTTTTKASSGTQQAPHIVTSSYDSADVFVAVLDVTAAPYSVDKTGSKDATSAIQQALNKAQTTYGGGIVFLPAGTYKITDTLTIPAQVTLKGEYNNKDNPGGNFGTVIQAETTASVFLMDKASGLSGVTVYYPKQSVTSPVKCDYTINATGGGFTVTDVTLLNSYKGIGVCLTGGSHGLATVSNLRGTCLNAGLNFNYGAEVDVVEKVNLAPSFWANAGTKYNAPTEAAIRTAMKSSIGFYITGCEDMMTSDCTFDGFSVGIQTGPTTRPDKAESYPEMYNVTVKNAVTAVDFETLYTDMGALLANCQLSGSTAALVNQSSYPAKLFNCTLSGSQSGNILESSASVTLPASSAGITKPTKKDLFVVTDYGAQADGSADDTAAFQKALAAAKSNGGGYVYIPGGVYKLTGALSVPANTQLVGSSAYATALEETSYAGVALFCYYGAGKSDTDTAFITLAGQNAGATGFQIYFPANGITKTKKTPESYAYAIRGTAAGNYVVNVNFYACWNGIEMSGANNFVIRRAVGAFYNNGIHVKNCTGGLVDNCLANGGQQTGGNYSWQADISQWVDASNVYDYILTYTRKQLTYLKYTGSTNQVIRNTFVYRANALLSSTNSTITASNLYSSYNLDYQYYVSGGSLTVVNSFLKQSKILSASNSAKVGIYNIKGQSLPSGVSESNILP